MQTLKLDTNTLSLKHAAHLNHFSGIFSTIHRPGTDWDEVILSWQVSLWEDLLTFLSKVKFLYFAYIWDMRWGGGGGGGWDSYLLTDRWIRLCNMRNNVGPSFPLLVLHFTVVPRGRVWGTQDGGRDEIWYFLWWMSRLIITSLSPVQGSNLLYRLHHNNKPEQNRTALHHALTTECPMDELDSTQWIEWVYVFYFF